MKDTNLNQLAIPIFVGMIVWFFGPGAILTYGIAVDWGQLESQHVTKLLDWRPLLFLLIAAFIFAVAVEAVLLFAAYIGNGVFIVFAPFVVGGWIGAMHGLAIGPFWLAFSYGVYPRDPRFVETAGAICGLIGTGIMILASMFFRRSTDWTP